MLLESEHIATLGSTTRARAWTTRTVLSPPRCCVCLSARSALLLDGGSSSAAAGLASSAVALAFVPSPRLSRPGASSLELAALPRSVGSASASRSAAAAAADARSREAAAGC